MRGITATAALIGALVITGIASPAAGAAGGPVILGGDDLTDHGGVNATTGESELGWLYMEKAIVEIDAKVVRSNDNSIAAFGSTASSATSADAGAGIGNAATKNGMTVQYFNGAAAINAGLASIADGSYRPAIIWIAGTGAENDIDNCSSLGSEGKAITDNAPAISEFVNEGGGLMAHSTCYDWLSALIPGLTTVEDTSSHKGDLYLTPEGEGAFPGVTSADVGAGPWHNFFEGELGGLEVLARSNTINDSTGADAAVVIGGDQVSLIDKPTDLSISMSDAPDPAPASGKVTYRLTVTNNGPEAATGIKVTDAIPSGVSVTSATATQGSCSGSATVTCNLGGLISGASATVTITVQTTEAGTLSNSANVTFRAPDPDETNNSASVTTTVAAVTDLAMSMSDSPDPATVGGNLTYTLAITNNGPNPATGVTVTDTLPYGLSARSASASQGSCAGSTLIRCSLGGLASGASATVTIVVKPMLAGPLSNSATVAADQPDPDEANGTAGAVTNVEQASAPAPSGGTPSGGTAPSESPSQRSADRTAPRVRLSGFGRRRCAQRTVNARFTVRDASRLQRVVVLLDGKRILRTTRRRFSVRIAVRRLRAGRHRLRVVASDRAGNRTSLSRGFRRCH